MSLVRQNFHQECEAAVNKQINLELYADYVYRSMSIYFSRDDVALPGATQFFAKQSLSEREHAEKLMKYQTDRGGRLLLQDVAKPAKDEWGTLLDAMVSALELEKNVNQSLIDMHALAERRNDAHLSDFLEEYYLREQVESIKEFGEFVTALKRVGPGLGEYLFDVETLLHHGAALRQPPDAAPNPVSNAASESGMRSGT